MEEEPFDTSATHGFQKIEGLHVLERIQVISEEEFVPGDKVEIFHLPDGNYLLSEDSEGIEIGRVTSTYILFKTDIVVKEI